jgi:hypothetical protein
MPSYIYTIQEMLLFWERTDLKGTSLYVLFYTTDTAQVVMLS